MAKHTPIPDSALNVLLADNAWLRGAALDDWKRRRLPEHYIERRIAPHADDHRVSLVVGPRQSGKSTLLWKTLSAGRDGFLVFNCEEPALREWMRSPALFLSGVSGLVAPGVSLLFEEVQHLEEAGLFLKGLVDRRSGHPLYATGSSAFDLDARTRESLAGRALRYVLYPLSLAERSAGIAGPPALRDLERDETVDRAAVYGGYPGVVSGLDPEVELTRLVEAFVIRDASDRFRIRNTAAFRKILELAATQIGNLVNTSEWSAVAGINAETTNDYAAVLEDAHILRRVRPFAGGKRAEVTSTPKLFFVDNGVRNRVFGGFTPLRSRLDAGALLENLVFTEIIKLIDPVLDTVHFWRSKSGAEVDFVVVRKGALTGVEVKAGDSRGKLSRSGRSFIEAYQPQRFFVVSRAEHPSVAMRRTEVRFVRFRDLPELFDANAKR